MKHAARDLALSAEERRALLILIEKMGERAVLAELKVSRQALGRALAGLGVRRGTVALVRAGLASPNLQAGLEPGVVEKSPADSTATAAARAVWRAPMTAPANDASVALEPEVLTVPELATLLRLKTKSVYALLSRDPDAIPGCRKVGGAWRVHRATVVSWLAGQNSDARQRQRGVR